MELGAIVNTELIERMSMDQLDHLAISQVAEDGLRLALAGEERLEAIRIMVEKSVPTDLMAWRLCMDRAYMVKIAHRAGIFFPKPPAHWTVEYVDRRKNDKRRKETH